MTGANEGRVPEQPRTEFAQVQVLFELAHAVSRAQNQSEICHAAVLRLVSSIAADQAAVIIDPDDVIVSRRGQASQASYRAAVEQHSAWDRGTRDGGHNQSAKKGYLAVSVSPP